jgi:hypothetical protein
MCPSNNTCRLSHYNHISNSELENRQYLKQLLWYQPNYVDRGYDHAMPTVVRQTLAKLDQYIRITVLATISFGRNSVLRAGEYT